MDREEIIAGLAKLGVSYKVYHYTADSSYPTEHTFTLDSIRAIGPTFEMGLLELLEKLITGINRISSKIPPGGE